MRSTRDFLTGIITGVAIGLLTAPRSGKETRDKLTEEANKRSGDLKGQWEKGVSQAKEGFEQAKTQVKEGFEQAKTQVNQYADKAKEQYDQYKNQAQNTQEKEAVKSQYNDKVDELANKAEVGIDDAKDSFKVN